MAATRSVEILKVMGARGSVVSQTVGNGGVVRMKIWVKRQELQQVLEQVIKKRDDNKDNDCKSNNVRKLSRSLASKSFETLLEDITNKKNAKSDGQEKRDYRSYWRPALQSIPEEF